MHFTSKLYKVYYEIAIPVVIMKINYIVTVNLTVLILLYSLLYLVLDDISTMVELKNNRLVTASDRNLGMFTDWLQLGTGI